MISLVVEAGLRSLSLGIVVWLAMVVFRPRNPHLQKTVWITVLLSSLVMPLVLGMRVTPSFDMPTAFITLAPGGSARANDGGTWQPMLRAISVVYLLITLGLLARFAAGLLAMSRIRRAATPLASADHSEIRVSSRIASPATFGSTILLPSSYSQWSAPMLAAILSHERSHVRYWDCYVQWLARLHACVFWFNPLAWWLNHRLADLAETTSDDAAIEATFDRTAYADALLEIAQHPAPTSVVASAARSNLSARIERIISGIPPALPPRRWMRGLAAASLIPLFVLATATAQSPLPASAASKDADPMRPRLIDSGNPTEQYYPVEAKRRGIEGYALVNATLDAEGHVTYVQVIQEEPADEEYGFTEAARQIAQGMRFSNPRHIATQVTFKVMFELRDHHQPPSLPGTTTNFESPAAPDSSR